MSSGLWAQVDPLAGEEARALFARLDGISLSFQGDQKILLGQQNAFLEGRGWRIDNSHRGKPLKSDMHEASGIHPAVFGLDFMEIGHWNREIIIEKIREVYARKGVITLSWHLKTLIDDGIGDNSFFDVSSPVVRHILPGGKAHEKYLGKLAGLISFLNEIKEVPVVFRPWHEHNFSWFWWGANHCTKEEYISLWRFTADHLKQNGIHNLLYAYSPGHLRDDFFDRYPGDDYVDIIGTDFYFKDLRQDTASLGQHPQLQWKKRIIWFLREAEKRNKIPVIAELGQEGMHYERFWTDYFGWPLERQGVQQLTGPDKLPKRGVAWILLWRNDKSSPTHFFGPYPGHKNNDNFMSLLGKGIFQGLE